MALDKKITRQYMSPNNPPIINPFCLKFFDKTVAPIKTESKMTPKTKLCKWISAILVYAKIQDVTPIPTKVMTKDNAKLIK